MADAQEEEVGVLLRAGFEPGDVDALKERPVVMRLVVEKVKQTQDLEIERGQLEEALGALQHEADVARRELEIAKGGAQRDTSAPTPVHDTLELDNQLSRDSHIQMLEGQVAQYKAQAQSLQQRLEKEVETQETYRLQVSEQTAKVESLMLRLVRQEGEAESLRAQLAESEKERSVLEGKVSAARQEALSAAASVATDLRIARAELAEEQERNEQLQTRISELEKMIETVHASSEENEAKSRDLLQARDAEIARFQTLTGSMERQAGALQAQIGQLKADLAQANSQHEATKQKAAQLQSQIEAQKTANAQALESSAAEIHTLKRKLEDTEQQLTMARNAQVTGSVPLAPAAKKLLEKENLTVTELFQRISELDSALSREKGENKRMLIYLEDLGKTLEERAPEYRQMQQDYAFLLKVSQQTSDRNLSLESQLQAKTSECTALAHQVRVAATQLANMETKKKDLEARAGALLQQVEALRAGQPGAATTIVNYESILRENADLKETARLAQEEATRLATSAISPSVVEELNSKIAGLQSEQAQSEQRISLLVRERDVYKELAQRQTGLQQVGGGTAAAAGPSTNQNAPTTPADVAALQLKIEQLEKELTLVKEYREEDTARAEQLMADLKKQLSDAHTAREVAQRDAAFNATRLQLLTNTTDAQARELALLHTRQKELYGELVAYEKQLAGSTEALAAATEKAALAEAHVRHLREQLQASERSHERTQKEVETVRAQLASTESLYTQLQAASNDLEHQRSILKLDWQQQMEEVKQGFSSERAQWQAETVGFEERIRKLRIDLQVAGASLAAETQQREQLEREIGRLQSDLQAAATKCALVETELGAANQKLAALPPTQETEQIRELKKAQALAAQHEATLKNREGDLASLAARSQDLEQQLREASEQIAALTLKVEELSVETRVRTLEDQLRQREEELNKTKADLATTMSKSRMDAAGAEAQISELKQQLSVTTAAKDNEAKQRSKLQAEKTRKEEEARLYRAKYEQKVQEVSDRIIELRGLREELKIAQAQLATERARVQDTTTLLEEAREHSRKVEAVAAEEREVQRVMREETERRIKSVSEVVTALTQGVKGDLSAELAKVGTELQLANADREIFRVKLESSIQELSKVRSELQQQQETNQTLSRDLAAADEKLATMQTVNLENQALKGKVHDAKRLAESNGQMRAEMSKLNKQNTERLEQLKTVQEGLHKARVELEVANKEKASLAEQVKTLERRVLDLKNENTQQRTTMAGMSADKLEQARAEIETLKTQLQTGNEKTQQLEAEKEKIASELEEGKRAKEEVDVLRKEKAELEVMVKEREEKLARLGAEGVENKISTLTAKFNSIIKRTKEDAARAAQRADEQAKTIATLETKLKDAESGGKLKELSDQLEASKKEIDEHKKKAAGFARKATVLEKILAAEKEAKANLTSAHADLETEKKKLEDSLAALQQAKKTAEEERRRVEEEKKRLETEIETLRGSLRARPAPPAHTQAPTPSPRRAPPPHPATTPPAHPPAPQITPPTEIHEKQQQSSSAPHPEAPPKSPAAQIHAEEPPASETANHTQEHDQGNQSDRAVDSSQSAAAPPQPLHVPPAQPPQSPHLTAREISTPALMSPSPASPALSAPADASKYPALRRHCVQEYTNYLTNLLTSNGLSSELPQGAKKVPVYVQRLRAHNIQFKRGPDFEVDWMKKNPEKAAELMAKDVPVQSHTQGGTPRPRPPQRQLSSGGASHKRPHGSESSSPLPGKRPRPGISPQVLQETSLAPVANEPQPAVEHQPPPEEPAVAPAPMETDSTNQEQGHPPVEETSGTNQSDMQPEQEQPLQENQESGAGTGDEVVPEIPEKEAEIIEKRERREREEGEMAEGSGDEKKEGDVVMEEEGVVEGEGQGENNAEGGEREIVVVERPEVVGDVTEPVETTTENEKQMETTVEEQAVGEEEEGEVRETEGVEEVNEEQLLQENHEDAPVEEGVRDENAPMDTGHVEGDGNEENPLVESHEDAPVGVESEEAKGEMHADVRTEEGKEEGEVGEDGEEGVVVEEGEVEGGEEGGDGEHGDGEGEGEEDGEEGEIKNDTEELNEEILRARLLASMMAKPGGVKRRKTEDEGEHDAKKHRVEGGEEAGGDAGAEVTATESGAGNDDPETESGHQVEDGTQEA